MSVIRRIIVAIEWLLLIPIILLAALFPIDLIDAWNSHPCSVRVTSKVASSCYPWGSTEGPLADAGWGYASQRNYLVSGWFLEFVLISLLVAAFWLRPGRRIVAMVVAAIALKAGQYFLPRILG